MCEKENSHFMILHIPSPLSASRVDLSFLQPTLVPTDEEITQLLHTLFPESLRDEDTDP